MAPRSSPREIRGPERATTEELSVPDEGQPRPFSGRFALTTYVSVTFGSAWLAWLPLLVAQYLSLPLPVPSTVLIVLGSFAPTTTAILLTWRFSGDAELRRLLQRALVWRVSPAWYALAVAGPALVMLLAMGVHVGLGGKAPDYVPFGVRWLLVAVNLVLVLLIGGPLGEEFGWRGVVLPALEARLGGPWPSLVLGLIWSFWHLPLFLVSAAPQQGFPYWLYVLLTLPLCLVITWVYHGSGDSLLLVMLLHAAVNTWAGPLRVSPEAAGSIRPLVLSVVLTWAAAMAVSIRRRPVLRTG